MPPHARDFGSGNCTISIPGSRAPRAPYCSSNRARVPPCTASRQLHTGRDALPQGVGQHLPARAAGRFQRGRRRPSSPPRFKPSDMKKRLCKISSTRRCTSGSSCTPCCPCGCSTCWPTCSTTALLCGALPPPAGAGEHAQRLPRQERAGADTAREEILPPLLRLHRRDHQLLHISDEEMRRRMVFEQTDIIDRSSTRTAPSSSCWATSATGSGYPRSRCGYTTPRPSRVQIYRPLKKRVVRPASS